MAVSIVINDFPKNISSLEPFSVGVTISGAKAGTNYLRIELYKDGSTNYFGETFNGSTWQSTGSGTEYFPVQIAGASASATIQGRLGIPTGNDYSGPGQYHLKIKRYTASGSAGSGDVMDSVAVQISYTMTTESPKPQVMPHQDIIVTNTQVPSPVVLTEEVEPSPIYFPTLTPIPSSTQSESPKATVSLSTQPAAKVQTTAKGSGSSFLPFVFIIAGVLLIIFSLWYNKLNANKKRQGDI